VRQPPAHALLPTSQGSCQPRRIHDVKPNSFIPTWQYSPAYHWKWEYALPYFDGEPAARFLGAAHQLQSASTAAV
jgi:hypothetical protein